MQISFSGLKSSRNIRVVFTSALKIKCHILTTVIGSITLVIIKARVKFWFNYFSSTLLHFKFFINFFSTIYTCNKIVPRPILNFNFCHWSYFDFIGGLFSSVINIIQKIVIFLIFVFFHLSVSLLWITPKLTKHWNNLNEINICSYNNLGHWTRFMSKFIMIVASKGWKPRCVL